MDIERILEKTDLARLVERAGGQLRRSGDGWRGACPLHGGDNPTAFVIYTGRDGRQRWHCHTHCGGGDAIDFVRLWHHLSDDAEGFVEAVRFLAELAGIPPTDVGLDAEKARQAADRRREQRRRQAMLEMAADYYARLLWSPAGQQGLEYARRRGWTDETIQELGLGYSDGCLLAHLRQQEADLNLAREVGLIAERQDGSLTDAIPARYLVYVHRLHDQVTYLSGRAS